MAQLMSHLLQLNTEADHNVSGIFVLVLIDATDEITIIFAVLQACHCSSVVDFSFVTGKASAHRAIILPLLAGIATISRLVRGNTY